MIEIRRLARTVATSITPLAVIALLLIAATFHTTRIYRDLHFDRRPCDFCVNYASALALRNGLDPYSIDLLSYADGVGYAGGVPHATDPPTYLMLFEPITFLPGRSAFDLSIAVNAAAFPIAMILLLGGDSGISTAQRLGLATLAIMYPPLDWHFDSSQNKLILLLLMIEAMRLLRSGRDRLGGCALALAGLLRIFPLLLGGYLLLRRRWRALAYFGFGLLIGTATTFAVVGYATSLHFLAGASILTGREWLDLDGNASLISTISRFFWDSGHIGGAADLARRSLCDAAWLAVVAVIAAATLGCAPGRGVHSDVDDRLFGLWTAAAVMLSPTAFGYDLIFLYLPFAQIAGAAARRATSNRAIYAAAGSYLLARNPDLLRQALALIGWPLVGIPPILGSRFFALFLGFVAAYWLVVDGDQIANGAVEQLSEPHLA